MMILFRRSACKGFSLAELAFALLVIGAVLGALWMRAGQVYQNMDVEKAVSELQAVVFSIRLAHPNDQVTQGEDINMFGVSPDMMGTFKGTKVLFNPWHGTTTVFPGNAVGWGQDTYNQEFTVVMSGVPSSTCSKLVLEASLPSKRVAGLIAAYISPAENSGHLICFNTDSYCVAPVAQTTESVTQAFCSAHNPMTVMFTYQAH